MANAGSVRAWINLLVVPDSSIIITCTSEYITVVYLIMKAPICQKNHGMIGGNVNAAQGIIIQVLIRD